MSGPADTHRPQQGIEALSDAATDVRGKHQETRSNEAFDKPSVEEDGAARHGRQAADDMKEAQQGNQPGKGIVEPGGCRASCRQPQGSHRKGQSKQFPRQVPIPRRDTETQQQHRDDRMQCKALALRHPQVDGSSNP